MILSGKDRSTRINLSSVKIRGLINNLTGNTNRGTHIKMWTFTYNLLRPKHVSIFFRPSSGILHQTSIHTTQTNYQTEKIQPLKIVDVIFCSRYMCTIGPYNLDITSSQNYRCWQLTAVVLATKPYTCRYPDMNTSDFITLRYPHYMDQLCTYIYYEL